MISEYLPSQSHCLQSVRSVEDTFFGLVSPLALFDFGQIALYNVYLLRQLSQSTQIQGVESPSSNQLQLLFSPNGRQVVILVPAFSNIFSRYCEKFSQ